MWVPLHAPLLYMRDLALLCLDDVGDEVFYLWIVRLCGGNFGYLNGGSVVRDHVDATSLVEAAHPHLGGRGLAERAVCGAGAALRRGAGGRGRQSYEPSDVTPETIRRIKKYVEKSGRTGGAFDIVWEGQTLGDDPERAASIVHLFAEIGATWWIESPWTPNGPDDLRIRIKWGPTSIG